MTSKHSLMILLYGCLAITLLAGCRNPFRGGGSAGDDSDTVNIGDPSALPPEGRDEFFGEDRRAHDVQFSSVLFGYDSAQVSAGESDKLLAVADYLQRNRSASLVVEGHCDERGSREYNITLGERRALAARAYLIGLGADGARLQTRSFGEERPVSPGHDEGAWRLNRRAEFVVYR